MQRLSELQRRGVEWFKARAHTAYAKAWLFFFSFTESSFFIVPPDLLLVAILLVNARQWIYYAALTTVASVLGAIFGYAIAAFFFDTVGIHIIALYDFFDEVEMARALFEHNAFWVIFSTAFTPIPYKVFVLAAGFLKINFFSFLAASILGRGLRYAIIAYSVRIFGDRASHLLSRYSAALTLAVIIIVIIFVLRTLLM